MKKSIAFFILSGFIAVLCIVSCEKSNIETLKEGYSSIEELNAEINKTLAFSSMHERLAYEKSKGFTSFGSICDQIYESVVTDASITTQEDLISLVKKYDEYLELITDEEGELYLETELYDNPKRYIINEQKEFIFADKVIKVFDDGEISMNSDSKELLSNIENLNDFNAGKNDQINILLYQKQTLMESFKATTCDKSYTDRETNGKNRTKIETALSLTTGGHVACRELVRPYKKSLGVWVFCSRSITYSFKYKVNVAYYGGTVKVYPANSTIVNTGSKSGSCYERNWTPVLKEGDIADYHFEGIDCWGDTPSTSPASFSCNASVLN